ncbi:TetR/AcrR family transcriptional regulator [Streptomyces sp. NPDC059256]|uniref:TetR/AcrR family transcriptional regulator n=1 Tax=Streptomyces sp. NPDC059256 TaxID=3346794 RepID=UPI0036A4CAFC
MARRHDPERRQRIIDAAIRIVGEGGITALTHRTVAAAADVPLGSTTYHFASLDELLIAALRQINQCFVAALRAIDPRPTAALPAILAKTMGEWLAADRTRVELEYELYLAALRRPALRPVAAEWTHGVVDHLSQGTDRATARALVALLDGICLQVLLSNVPYDEEYAREMLGRVLRS